MCETLKQNGNSTYSYEARNTLTLVKCVFSGLDSKQEYRGQCLRCKELERCRRMPTTLTKPVTVSKNYDYFYHSIVIIYKSPG